MKDDLKATVQKIISNGSHGPYAVATGEGVEGSITFSLNKKVWKEKVQPEEGSIVVLSSINKKASGWRANEARFFNLCDKKAMSNEQNVKGWPCLVLCLLFALPFLFLGEDFLSLYTKMYGIWFVLGTTIISASIFFYTTRFKDYDFPGMPYVMVSQIILLLGVLFLVACLCFLYEKPDPTEYRADYIQEYLTTTRWYAVKNSLRLWWAMIVVSLVMIFYPVYYKKWTSK